jgi:hypothetical protein
MVRLLVKGLKTLLAESEGFEPPVQQAVQRFSRPPLSTTQPTLQRQVSANSLKSIQVDTLNRKYGGPQAQKLLMGNFFTNGLGLVEPFYRQGLAVLESKILQPFFT